MGDHAGVAAIQDLNGLRATEHAQRRFADLARPGGSHELNVIGLRGSCNDLKRRVAIPNLNGIEDALRVGDGGVDCVVEGSVRPKTCGWRTGARRLPTQVVVPKYISCLEASGGQTWIWAWPLKC